MNIPEKEKIEPIKRYKCDLYWGYLHNAYTEAPRCDQCSDLRICFPFDKEEEVVG